LFLSEEFLIPNSSQAESKVFCLKTKQDYYCFLVEVAAGDEKKGIVDQSQRAYREAFEISKKQMQPTQPHIDRFKMKTGNSLNVNWLYSLNIKHKNHMGNSYRSSMNLS